MNVPEIDHLIYGVPDLAKAIADFERKTGVIVSPGGRHLEYGTHNALVSLGKSSYLEFLAPDPNKEIEGEATLLGLNKIDSPKLLAWVVAKKDLVEFTEKSSLSFANLTNGSRECADGSKIQWKFTYVESPEVSPVIPFLLEWDSAHPSSSMGESCKLAEFYAIHPSKETQLNLLRELNSSLDVRQGAEISLNASIATPQGIVSL